MQSHAFIPFYAKIRIKNRYFGNYARCDSPKYLISTITLENMHLRKSTRPTYHSQFSKVPNQICLCIRLSIIIISEGRGC